MTDSSANLRALPGLYGGGFARVLDVQTIAGGRLTGDGGPIDALVRLEKLKDPLQSFSQSLQKYTQSPLAASAPPTQRLSGDVLTLLQQIDPSQKAAQAAAAPTPMRVPGSGGEDGNATTLADLLDAQLAKREQAKAEQERTQKQRDEQKTNQPDTQPIEPSVADKLGPDLVKQLDALLEKRIQLDIPSSTVTANEVTGEVVAVSPAQAARAAQTYASTLTDATA